MQDHHLRSGRLSRVARAFAITVAVLAGAQSVHAQAPSTVSPALQSLIEAAKAEKGTLDIMNASIADAGFIDDISKGMSKRYGFPIRLNVVPGPTPSALAPQLVQEFKAGRQPSSDVFLGDDVNAMVQIEANSVMETDWKALDPTLLDEAIGPRGTFLRLSSRIVGCVWYNTNLVTPGDVPRTLQDVLKPKWKGRIASTSFIAGFREAAGLFGKEQEMVDFLKAFSASGNLAGFIRGGAAERIASGEFAMMVVAPGEYPALKLRSEGAPVAYTVLQEMPYISYWVMNVPKGSAHPNLAKLFALYMSTREGQDYFYKSEFYDLHFLNGSKTAESFKTAFRDGLSPVVITNEILTSKWRDYERVTPILTRSIRGGK